MPIDDNKSINNFGWEPQWQLRFPKTVLDVNSENPPGLIFDFKSQNSKLDKSLDTKNSNIFIGVMIETPAAVFMADELAAEVDFFSIGTNDLTQYVLAVDRGNRRIAAMYDTLHPAVVRAMRLTVDAAHRHGCEVGICKKGVFYQILPFENSGLH